MTLPEDPLLRAVSEALDQFSHRYLKRIEKEQQRLKACKINTVLQSKRSQELKTNGELKANLAELSKKGDDIERICAGFSSGLTITDSDQQRLDNVKEMVKIGKKLTGIRFDYSAPSNIVKGYIKRERDHTLAPFEMSAEAARDQLWDLLASGKENLPRN